MDFLFDVLLPGFVTVLWDQSESFRAELAGLEFHLILGFYAILPVNFTDRKRSCFEIIVDKNVRSALLSVHQLTKMGDLINWQFLNLFRESADYFLDLLLSGLAIDRDKFNNSFEVRNCSINFLCIDLNTILR